jgi:hypothetical protein
MKRVLETSETLGMVTTPGGPRELCASAVASYEEPSGKLTVKLEAFLRNTDLVTKEQRFPAGWLPNPETVCETVGMEETVELAREIFQRWVRKVSAAAPALHHV